MAANTTTQSGWGFEEEPWHAAQVSCATRDDDSNGLCGAMLEEVQPIARSACSNPMGLRVDGLRLRGKAAGGDSGGGGLGASCACKWW